ncbi:hypothetical protein COW09_00815 [bacterium (Candidatus Moisslbacteria) CG12_big_fil_rev_8_21_14_0_65_36_11]|nr:glycosyltransferase family 2 protein [Candidatus Kuenenbacteria bacterium]OIP76891.1 MAG: hypothetical protein AUK09_00860 [Parcubacteria group bacterium CG2_30_36_38]PIV45907.1 MAG: hypothetical protein COS23_01920 [bacterium (Candidatus Moisslbacteria) CG02_land_8_20_14_3_00_36_53]PIW67979.1 MAG: hypothetical protein COW09_00815 [bacterium (Candidatus Moisslbacteria) CG12_big_fil_rev_8_21_14_0_65_36_11]PIZ90175.1 MAG: hypothetical protein COX87_02005 [bacterium (Candidatus Moisslbacteria) 
MISIIVVNYNQKDWLEKCLQKISACGGSTEGRKEAKINLPYEIIIIDNASTDGSEVVIDKFRKEFSNLEFIKNNKNLGFAQAVNQGIKMAKGGYFFISNPDVLITPGSLEEMRDFLVKHEEVGLLGPRLINPDGGVQSSCFSFPCWYTPFIRRTFLGDSSFGKKELKRYLMEDFNHQEIREVDWLLGGALMARRQAVEKVGLMDERFFLYFEDVDWCRRFKKNGFKVLYFPEVSMSHYYQRLSAQNRGFKALFDKLFWIHIISAVKYFWKWRKKNCGVV